MSPGEQDFFFLNIAIHCLSVSYNVGKLSHKNKASRKDMEKDAAIVYREEWRKGYTTIERIETYVKGTA